MTNPTPEMIARGVEILHGTARDSDTYTVEAIYLAMVEQGPDVEAMREAREALADWDKYDPDASRQKILVQAIRMADAIRAALGAKP